MTLTFFAHVHCYVSKYLGSVGRFCVKDRYMTGYEWGSSAIVSRGLSGQVT